jgi:DNA-binding GntR family transcriptional regulator
LPSKEHPIVPKSLSTIARQTAAEAATSALFNGIIDGTLAPGSHLRLQDLAEQFGLSMMPVREALRRLADLGLVELEPHKGAFVRPMTLDDVVSTYETRFLLEGEAAYLAAKRFTADQRAVAQEALDHRARYLERGDAEHARDAHERFHFTIYEAASNPWLVRCIMPLWRNAERYRLESMRRPELAAQRAREHDAILIAVSEGDGDAARERMVTHLRSSMDLILSTFADTDDGGHLPDGETDVDPAGSPESGSGKRRE